MAVGYCLCRTVKRGQNCIIRQAMAEKKADWFVLTSLDDIAWLLNFRGNDVQDNPVVLAYLMMSADSLRLYTKCR